MKFSSIVPLALSLTTVVSGSGFTQKRQTTPVQAISNTASILQSTVNTNQVAVFDAVTALRSNAGAAAQLTAQINANIDAIVQALGQAIATVNTSIVNAGTGVGGQGTALAQTELDSLRAALVILANVVSGISATVFFQATNLRPAAKKLVAAEVAQLEAALVPFINPVQVFSDAASKASAAAGASVSGTQGAYIGLQLIVQKFAQDNGVTGFAFPGFVTTQ